MLVHSSRQQTSIERRRAERELFFWTAFEALKLIVLGALAIYLVVLLVDGDLPISYVLFRGALAN